MASCRFNGGGLATDVVEDHRSSAVVCAGISDWVAGFSEFRRLLLKVIDSGSSIPLYEI